MFIPTVSTVKRRSPPSFRAAITVLLSLGMVVSPARTSEAQTSASRARAWELRFSSGAFLPTGIQRNFLKDAQISAAQLSWVVRPSFAVTGTFGWARSRDLTSVDTPKLDVFTSDLGVEVRRRWFADRAVTFSPFAGIGAGARSYNYRTLDVGATHNLAGYGTLGGDLGIGRVGLRLEARNYATGFKPLAGAGRSSTRNDVIFTAALSLKKHRAARD
jgi:hypothetical protein